MDFTERWGATEDCLVREAGSLGELLEQLRGRISRVLIGDREWARLSERAHQLPVTMAAFPFGFELPLLESRPAADFGVSIVGGSRSARFFEERGRAEDAGSSMRGIAGLLAETEQEESHLRRLAGRKMLLEYDIASEDGGAHPDPGIFLYPAEDVLIGDGQRLRDLAVVVDAVDAATGLALDAAERRQVELVYLAMEADTSVRAVGAFPSRDRGLRLAITGFRHTPDVMSYLERTAWPGERSAVASLCTPLEKRGAFAYMGVHLDVHADGVGPRLGLSFYAREGQWLKDIQHWIPLIDGIREQRLAVPTKLSELTDSWAGAETLFGKSGPIVLVRGIHHFKFVLVDDRIEQVKAYVFALMLGLRPQ